MTEEALSDQKEASPQSRLSLVSGSSPQPCVTMSHTGQHSGHRSNARFKFNFFLLNMSKEGKNDNSDSAPNVRRKVNWYYFGDFLDILQYQVENYCKWAIFFMLTMMMMMPRSVFPGASPAAVSTAPGSPGHTKQGSGSIFPLSAVSFWSMYASFSLLIILRNNE